MKNFEGLLSAISLAFAIAPGMPLAASVKTISAPITAMTRRRSIDIDSGMVRISL